MMTTCPTCGTIYDHARRLTICPHAPLMNTADMKRKEAGLLLFGRLVRFAHTEGPYYRVEAVGYSGMVMLHRLPGWFEPREFIVGGVEVQS